MPALIPGGYYIKARCIMQSEIMRSPPYVREVWDWLLMNANHKDAKSSGTDIKRGQLFTSLDEIRDGLAWYIGYRKMTYTKDHMKKAMKALKKASMIATSVSTRGFMVTICNYDYYQASKNYESTNESTDESSNEAPSKHRGTPAINKNGNNGRMEELKDYTVEFEEFWKMYIPVEVSKGEKQEAKEVFLKTIKGGVDYERIREGVRAYIDFTQRTGTKTKQVARWLKKRGWLDELPTATEPFKPCFGEQNRVSSYPGSKNTSWRSESERIAAKYRGEVERRVDEPIDISSG